MSTQPVTLVAEQLHTAPEDVLIDVRSPAEYDSVHVPGSVLLPLADITAEAVGRHRKSGKGTVYLICQTGTRSQLAATKLAAEGLTNVIGVDGGIEAWTQAGLQVHRGEKRVISLERQVRIGAGSVVVTGVLLSLFVHPAFIWLSAFVGSGLIFAGITDWCGLGLLLARAPWNQGRAAPAIPPGEKQPQVTA